MNKNFTFPSAFGISGIYKYYHKAINILCNKASDILKTLLVGLTPQLV